MAQPLRSEFGFWINKCSLLAFLAVMLADTSLAESKKPFAVLPAEEAQDVGRLCSRVIPSRIEAGWVPSVRDIKRLEEALSRVKAESQDTISNPFGSYRQYVGIVTGGRRA